MKELIIKIYGLNYNELILLIFSLAIISFLFFTFIVIIFEKRVPFKTPYNFLVTASAFSLLPFIFMLCIKAFIELFGFSLKTLDEKWLNFLGSYIGVCGAIGCVWWQLERQKKDKEIENKKLEVEAVVTFLILYRETCENFSYFYVENNKKLPIKNNSKDNPFIVNYELFNSLIIKMDIDSKNKCIELLYLLDKFSFKNKILNIIMPIPGLFLEELYDKLDSSCNKILSEYEIIKKEEQEYINIIQGRIDNDLSNLFKSVDECFDKYKNKR